MCVCVCVYIDIEGDRQCIYICEFVYVYIYTREYLACVYVCMCVYICVYIYTHNMNTNVSEKGSSEYVVLILNGRFQFNYRISMISAHILFPECNLGF